ncbi:MAG: class I SAM-dependent methyltransferase [Clostridiales bacterium]|nr:class I SAM-dependent methyltransferase [Candidatus Equinaster intestinalis]
MSEPSRITVCAGPGAAEDFAEAVARRVGVPLSTEAGSGLTLMIDKSGVYLTNGSLTYKGDFERMLPRVTEGRLSHEMLVHVSKTKTPHPTAIDATAGMGEDSFLLAAAGYNVTLFEQDPIIAALLKDALRRAKKHPVLREIAERMQLIEGDSIELLPRQKQVDLIYLDTMFPARQRSGLINKKLQLIQSLERPCPNGEALLTAAFCANPQKIVIKRPLKGEFLGGRQPQYSVKGKAIRYDCFVLR